MFRFLFVLLIASLLAALVYSNADQLLVLNFFWGMETEPLPLFAVILGLFLTGFVAAALLFVPAWVRTLFDRRRKSKRIEQLEMDLDKMRATALQSQPPSEGRRVTDGIQSDLL